MGTPKCMFFILIGLQQFILTYQQTTNTRLERKRTLDQLLENYDAELRPSGINGTDGPVIVKVNMRLKSINSISDYDMDFGVQIMLRQEWVDERLKYEDKDVSTSSDVIFLWREVDPVQISKNIDIIGFTLGNVFTSTFQCSRYPEEKFCLKAEMYFKRDLKYYILHTFLPSTVLVMVSWASFWMERQAVVALILLVLSTLFAMSSLATDIEASVSHVPYVKAMDLWVAVCFAFLLAALVEFVIINATSPDDGGATLGEVRNEDGSTTVDMKPLVRKSTDSSQPPCKQSSQIAAPPFYQLLLKRLPRDPSRIDSVARVLFPSAFLVFFFLFFLAYYIFEVQTD